MFMAFHSKTKYLCMIRIPLCSISCLMGKLGNFFFTVTKDY